MQLVPAFGFRVLVAAFGFRVLVPAFGFRVLVPAFGSRVTASHDRVGMRIALIVLSSFAIATASAAETPHPPFPEFSLPLIDGSARPLQRSQLAGKVTYVDFWASWCVPCRASFPWLDGIYRKYQDRGFRVIAINKDQEPAEIERFLKRYPVSFALTTDPLDSLAKSLRVTVMPTAYLIDRQGMIRVVHRGFRSEDMAKLEHEIVSLLEQP